MMTAENIQIHFATSGAENFQSAIPPIIEPNKAKSGPNQNCSRREKVVFILIIEAPFLIVFE